MAEQETERFDKGRGRTSPAAKVVEAVNALPLLLDAVALLSEARPYVSAHLEWNPEGLDIVERIDAVLAKLIDRHGQELLA
jgi:hypothetical protein